MKRSKIIEERRRHVNPEVRERVSLSFQIVDRIHEILVARGLRQKDLAMMLGKSRTITAPTVLAQSTAPTVIVQENKALREILRKSNAEASSLGSCCIIGNAQAFDG